MSLHKWPYANEIGQEEHLECDVLVLGGGLAGCYAAIAAARKGQKVILMEKGATKRSGGKRIRPLGICMYQSGQSGDAERGCGSLYR